MSLVSTVRNLQRRNARRRNARAVLEGVRLVEEALAADVELDGAVVGPALGRTERGAALERTLREATSVEDASDRDIAALADTDTPQGVIAIARFAPRRLDDLIFETGVVVVLDGLGNPGNAGAVIRTAYAIGASGVVLLDGTVAYNHPKLLRATMGAAFRIPVATADRPSLLGWLEAGGIETWVAAADGVSVVGMETPQRLAVIIGSEGDGVSAELARAASAKVAVPMLPGAESLNAAVAAGILLHEVLRDR